MKIFGYEIRRESRSAENPQVPVSAANFLAHFGIDTDSLPRVTVDTALHVPAVQAAVTFISRSLANLPLHAHRKTKDGRVERIAGGLQTLVNEAPTAEWSSFGWRVYMWQQVFTHGRGITQIERAAGGAVLALNPVDPVDASVSIRAGRKIYRLNGMEYQAAEVLDIPYMLKRDMVGSYSPIFLASKAIQLALAMNDYGSGFFAGGGVPPLALVGPMPQGAEALQRAMSDVSRVIDTARRSNKPLFPIPPGHELKQVGFEPSKGQMTEARRFQIEEIARAFNLPPIFLQDLTHGTFSNSEQQDLHLAKHLIAQWAKAFEDELNLKLFGQMKNGRWVEHNLDGLQRGDFTSRMNGLSQAVQNALLTPNEGRDKLNLPAMAGGNSLMIQGATVPLGLQQDSSANGGNDEN